MIVRGAILIFILTLPSAASAADGIVYMEPARGTYTIGESFEVAIRADTDGETISAVEADLSFPPGALLVEKISTDGSILSQWPTPPSFSNTEGTIRFSGTGANFSGDDGLLVTVTFTAVSPLPGAVQIDSGAMLAADARATNIITSMRSSLYSVVPRKTTSAPEIQQVEEVPGETPEPVVAGASIQVPSIMGYDDVVSVGERIVLQGSATPDSTVYVLLQYGDEAPAESMVRATRDGSFTYVSPGFAEAGLYRAWAEAGDGEGRVRSDEVSIRATRDGFVAAVALAGPMMLIALPYLLLLIAAGCVLGFVYNRRAATRQ